MEIRVFKQVEKVLRNETKEIREDIADILEKLVMSIPLGMPHIKSLANIHSDLYEIRVKDRGGQFRVVYFLSCREAIYLIHAFRKKTQKMSTSDKVVILKRLKELKNEKD